MINDLTKMKDKILHELLPQVEQNGWSWTDVQEACARLKLQDEMARAVFPNGLSDAVAHFSDMTDRQMLQKLEKIDVDALRVRDRIRSAVMVRYRLLADKQASVKASLAYWALPQRLIQGQQVLWRTSDRIWNWAGDTATDYNRQTKRGLLSSILIGTSMVFIEDDPDSLAVTESFLNRRIENILEIGKAMGMARKLAPEMGSIVPNLFRNRASD
jgi:ubiquinone biosynthesis protein COQ9